MQSGLAMAEFFTHVPHQANAIHYSRPDPNGYGGAQKRVCSWIRKNSAGERKSI